MDLAFELTIVGKLAGAFALGALVGYDRERQGQSAGIRTCAAVSMGAALFALISIHLEDPAAPTYIIAHICVGIGFLGAGMIFRDTSAQTAHGLTTAASIWCTAGVGVAVGIDMYVLAVVATLALYLLLSMERWKWYIAWKERIQNEGKGKKND